MKRGSKAFGYSLAAVYTVVDTGIGIEENIANGESAGEIISDAAIDVVGGIWSLGAGVTGEKIGTAIGTAIAPGIGSVAGGIIGFGLGLLIGWGINSFYDERIDPALDNRFYN